MKEVINDVTARPDGFRRTEHLFGESLSPSLSPAGADVEHSKHSVASETIPLQRIGFAGDTRRPRRRRRRRRRWGETHTRHADFVECGAGAREQKNRWRVIAWSAVGLACLLMSHWLRPENGSLFEFPEVDRHLFEVELGASLALLGEVEAQSGRVGGDRKHVEFHGTISLGEMARSKGK